MLANRKVGAGLNYFFVLTHVTVNGCGLSANSSLDCVDKLNMTTLQLLAASAHAAGTKVMLTVDFATKECTPQEPRVRLPCFGPWHGAGRLRPEPGSVCACTWTGRSRGRFRSVCINRSIHNAARLVPSQPNKVRHYQRLVSSSNAEVTVGNR
jgi:hypothetical protein